MNNSKTILAVGLLMAGTLLTTTAVTTMVPAAYAGGHNDDGNQQKAEDESQAAFDDCYKNDVERAGFDCIAIAESEIEIPEEEPPEEEPPEEGLIVCKVVENPPQGVSATDFHFIIQGETGFDDETQGFPPPECNFGLSPVPVGGYRVTEDSTGDAPPPTRVEVEGDCTLIDGEDPPAADGEVEEGEIDTCTFINIYEIDS
jgi:hypothetical protein